MALNLDGLAQATTTATTLSNLVLVTPQKQIGYRPQNAPTFVRNTAAQKDSYLFHFPGEQSVQLNSDITDHAIENNEFVNDQIALKPELVTVREFLGELNNVPPVAVPELKLLQEKLLTIAVYTPALSESALLAYNVAFQGYQVADAAVRAASSTFASIKGSLPGQESVSGGAGVINGSDVGVTDTDRRIQTQQQRYFQTFYSFWRSRTLFTVQTPWAIFQDMAILSLKAVQDEDTAVITSFEITFKIMRFAEALVTRQARFTPVSGTQGRFGASSSSLFEQNSTLETSSVQFNPTGIA